MIDVTTEAGRKALRELCEKLGRREWRIDPEDELCVQSYSENAGVGEEWSDVFDAYHDGIPQAIIDLRAAVPALLDALEESEREIAELTAPFSSGDPTKLTKEEWARIHRSVEKYGPKTEHVYVNSDGISFLRLDFAQKIIERAESENAALRARVAALERVREAAMDLQANPRDDWSHDNLRAALAAAPGKGE